LHGRRAIEGLVDAGFELDHLAAAEATVGGDNELRFAVVDAILDGFGLNPPKITVWMAPTRAQASMAITASGIIGK
jgi:hypothetical protein